MIDCIVDGVNIFNPIEGVLDKIIEYFVKFYGEKHRERINDRVLRTTFLFLGEIDKGSKTSTLADLKNYYSKKVKEICNEYYKEISAQNYALTEKFNIKNIENILSTLNLLKLKVYDKLTDEQIDNLFMFLDIIGVIKYVENEKSVNTLLNIFKDNRQYKLLYEKCYECYQIWNSKYSTEYYKTLDEFIKNHKILSNLEGNAKKTNNFYKNDIDNLFIELIYNATGISKENIKNDKNFDFYTEVIIDIIEKQDYFITNYDKKNRKKLFNYLGIDHGDDYNAYINDPKLANILQLNLITKKYKQFNNLRLKEMAYNPGYLEDAYSILKDQGINIFNDNLGESIFRAIIDKNNCLAWVTFLNYIGLPEVENVCVCKNYFKLDTLTLIHEINHVLEQDFLYRNGEFFGYKSGFICSDKDFKKMNDVEIFNEVVNEYMAYRVFELFKKDNFYIGYNKESESEYSKMFLVLGEFLEENIELLKECRMSSNPYLFAQIIGLNNFEMLNQAMKNCYTLNSYEIIEANKEINEKAKNNFVEPLSKNAQLLHKSLKMVDKVTENVRKKVNPELIK